MNPDEVFAKANKLGIINGEIKIVIINQRIKAVEYLIREVDKRNNLDAINPKSVDKL